MATYTVKQLARLSGVSVRTLHHYDEIGLLKPSFVGENRYRYYGRDELLRLQDILFHRELGVPLQEIAKLLAREGRDRVAILSEHRALLAERIGRSRRLLTTIDRTIAELNGAGAMKDKDLYHGFAPEKQAEYEDWLVDNYGDAMRHRIAQSQAAVGKMGPQGMAAAMAECAAAEDALVECFRAGTAADAAGVELALERHRAWVGTMWGRECPREGYGGLADLYLAHPDFRARYEARGEGFTAWLTAAMKAYAARA
ncbi:MAG TPA: MerR family transcriptional regulator [Croceibacterium sp.]|nr:MerR family transcriptional regulator [Croceibacterium sp.]